MKIILIMLFTLPGILKSDSKTTVNAVRFLTYVKNSPSTNEYVFYGDGKETARIDKKYVLTLKKFTGSFNVTLSNKAKIMEVIIKDGAVLKNGKSNVTIRYKEFESKSNGNGMCSPCCLPNGGCCLGYRANCLPIAGCKPMENCKTCYMTMAKCN